MVAEMELNGMSLLNVHEKCLGDRKMTKHFFLNHEKSIKYTLKYENSCQFFPDFFIIF